jgi:hypothetical protein
MATFADYWSLIGCFSDKRKSLYIEDRDSDFSAAVVSSHPHK